MSSAVTRHPLRLYLIHRVGCTTGLALGAVKFILRPIDPLALLAEVQDCLQPS